MREKLLIILSAIADWLGITAFLAIIVKQDPLLVLLMTVVAIPIAIVVYRLISNSPGKRVRVALIVCIASLVLAIVAWSLLASSELTSLKVNIIDPQDGGSFTRLSGSYLAKGTVSDSNARVYVLVRTLPATEMWVLPPAIVDGKGNWQASVYFGDEMPRIGEKYQAIALATNDNFLVTWATGNSFSEGQKVRNLPRKSNKSSLITVTRSEPVPEDQAILADGIFRRILVRDSGLANALGGRVMPQLKYIWSSYQPFQTGEMIWRSDMLNPTDIYVLFRSGEWKPFKSNYKSGSPLHACAAEPPQEYRLQPILGFGKVWCDNQDVKEKLGYAVIEEKPLDRPLQTFDNGWLILINNYVYVLFEANRSWKSIRAFEYETIPLQKQSELEAQETNLGLAPRTVYLPDSSLPAFDPLSGKPLSVPFDVGWKASTQCRHLPTRPDYIQIDTNISNPLSVYLLLQAGWGLKKYGGQRIGRVSLEFDNGKSFDIPLILRDNIRDWADRPVVAVTEVSSPYSRLAWEGTELVDKTPGRMDILINDIPSNYWPLTLKRIQIWDESIRSSGGIDPCIHLLAATAKYLP